MASEQPKGPSWKNQAANTGTPARPAKSHKAWQPSGKTAAKAPSDPKARFRKRLLAAGVTGSLLIAAVIVVIWLWKPPKQPALLLAAPDTISTLSSPANVYAANGVKSLADWAGQSKDRPRLVAEGTSASRDGWKASLGKVNEKGVILYFAAPGAVDKSGPYLWMTPGDATNVDEAQKLPVKEILQKLAELPADKLKLVLFDAALVPADWAHGYLLNDFARSLKTLDSEIEKIPNLVVICSSDDDQRSWVSEEWRQTIFGHFVNQGVRGGAGKDQPRITAALLFDFLKKEIGNWSRANRDAEQTPVLLPTQSGKDRADKFEIASIDPSSYQVPSAASAPGNSFSVPTELKAAWETAEKLASRSPPPETAAPNVWRSYVDTLLRWEHLVRAGANPDAIQRQADALERELGQGLFDTDPPCLANSLAVAPAFGIAPASIESTTFNQIWNPLPGKKPEELWRDKQLEMRAKDGERGVAMLRLAAARKVLERLAQPENGPTPENLERASQVLAIIDESQPRPIESHYLLMLQRDLAKQRPDQTLIIKAMQLRLEAERVAWLSGAKDGYSYAEQTYRWIEKSIKKADRDRRLGEDLLPAVDKVSWGKAQAYFTSAVEQYAHCAADAVVAAEGLRARDRAFSRLPYYARWIAAYRGVMPESEVERMLKLIEKMANDAQQLSEKLDDVTDNAAGRLAEIKNLTMGMKADSGELTRVFDADTSNLTGTVLPSNWHAIENALSVPFLPVERRMKLLNDIRSISRQLNEKSQTQSAPTAASAFNAKEMAQRQGRMAVAILGERWIEDEAARARAPRGSTLLHMGELKQRITQPNAGAWWDSLREAGEQIGWHFREMLPAINSDLDEAGQVELKQVPKFLSRGVLLTRMLDSATGLARDRSPTAEERRYWTHEMMLWQARRTIDDGWASLTTGPTSKPYCEEAGERYAQAAEKLILGNNPAFETRERTRRLADVKATRDLLKAPSFTLDWPKVLDLTEDRDFAANYKITAPAGSPVGIPVLRINSVNAPLKVADTKLDPRLPQFDFADGKPSVDKRLFFAFNKLDKQGTALITGMVNADLLYRGHIFDLSTKVSLMDKADIEWVHVPPVGKARFSIVCKKELQQGAVALIVDQTKSMYDTVGGIKGGPRKIEEVIKAVNAVLEQLPADTFISIFLFHGDVNENVKFTTLTEPIRWNETVVQKADIYKKVRAISPPDDADTTPLTKMLIQLSERGDAFPKQFGGFRSVVVLTDGDDNISADPKDPSKPGRRVVEALRANDNDIALHMVLFGLSPQEDASARRQFAPIEDPDNFEKAYRTPGKIWSGLKSQKELVEALRESMLPKVQIVRGLENGERLPRGLPVSLPGEQFLRWSPPLEPGTYQLRALGSRKILHLEPGDRVLLEMVREGGKMDLRIPQYADILNHIPANLRTDSTDNRVHLTLTKNSLTDRGGTNDLQMVTTLEAKTQGREEELRVNRPLFTWFEVNPRNAGDGGPSRTLRIENLRERVAPAWEVNVGPWAPETGKKDARANPSLPGLDAWWVDRFPGDPYRFVATRLETLDSEFGKIDKRVTVDRSNVSIDDIRVEDNFLYVRTTHEDGKPIVVRVLGLKKDEQRLQLGELHRWYNKANKYTARFGPIERGDYGRQVTINFFSLDSVKKAASQPRLEPEKPQPDTAARDLLPRIKAEE